MSLTKQEVAKHGSVLKAVGKSRSSKNFIRQAIQVSHHVVKLGLALCIWRRSSPRKSCCDTQEEEALRAGA